MDAEKGSGKRKRDDLEKSEKRRRMEYDLNSAGPMTLYQQHQQDPRGGGSYGVPHEGVHPQDYVEYHAVMPPHPQQQGYIGGHWPPPSTGREMKPKRNREKMDSNILPRLKSKNLKNSTRKEDSATEPVKSKSKYQYCPEIIDRIVATPHTQMSTFQHPYPEQEKSMANPQYLVNTGPNPYPPYMYPMPYLPPQRWDYPVPFGSVPSTMPYQTPGMHYADPRVQERFYEQGIYQQHPPLPPQQHQGPVIEKKTARSNPKPKKAAPVQKTAREVEREVPVERKPVSVKPPTPKQVEEARVDEFDFEDSSPFTTYSVIQLAQITGLIRGKKKEWRYRDVKRSLLNKLSEDHQSFIQTTSHSLLTKRLPHKLSLLNFVKRISLIVFHFYIRDGRPPRFWKDKVNKDVFTRELEKYDPSFMMKINMDIALDAHEFIVSGMSVRHAVEKAQLLYSQNHPGNNATLDDVSDELPATRKRRKNYAGME